MQAHQSMVTYAITAAVMAFVLALRWRRMSRARPLKLERLWMFPAFYAVVAVGMFVARPPHGWAWLFCLLALGGGAALGWQRGKMMRITVDAESHALNQTASPGAMLLLLLLVAVKIGARDMIGGGALDATAVTDMLAALALGLFTTQRLEMYLRGRRMLEAARA